MKVTRVIEYEGPEVEVRKVLERSLLTAQAVVKSGDIVPGVGPIMAGRYAPKVTISLIDQREERD